MNLRDELVNMLTNAQFHCELNKFGHTFCKKYAKHREAIVFTIQRDSLQVNDCLPHKRCALRITSRPLKIESPDQTGVIIEMNQPKHPKHPTTYVIKPYHAFVTIEMQPNRRGLLMRIEQ